jgi:threonine dehydrogenase-like Zn-dependent dehydrogenase
MRKPFFEDDISDALKESTGTIERRRRMRALTYQGKRSLSVETVPDPVVAEPTDAIVRITSTAICGSDLHPYELFGPFLDKGDILGHEPMGIVEEVGSEVRDLAVGDRVVVTFTIACGHCYMCARGLQSQCETTPVREHGSGAALFGYTKLYGQVLSRSVVCTAERPTRCP